MSGRGERGLAATSVVVATVFGIAAVVLYGPALANDAGSDVWTWVVEGIGASVGMVTAWIGTLLVVRRPGNVIGRLLCLAGASYGLLMVSYAYVATNRSGSVLVAAALMSEWAWMPAFLSLLVLIPLRFPDGRLLAPGWRWVERTAIAAMGVAAVAGLFRPGPLVFEDELLPVRNPLGVEWLASVRGPVTVVATLGVVAVPVAFLALVLRYRRSDRLVRQQVTALVASLGAVIALVLAGAAVPGLARATEHFNVYFLVVPVAIANAVLRHSLYDIGRIVSRTVTWASLTLVLIGVYAVGAVVLSVGARTLTAGESSDLVVALSTLAVAAVFRPARLRIQKVVDRRFNRARYDAARTIASFTQRLRDEVELEAVTDALMDVATTAMQPAGVSLVVLGAPVAGAVEDTS